MDWGGTPLWICWRVLRWKSQHLIWMTKMRILEACCMCWNFEAPPDSTMSAQSIETFECYFDVLKWPHRILVQLFAVNASQIHRQFLTAWHRYLSTSIWGSKSTPRFPAFFVGQTLVFLSLARSEASFWEDHWCLKHSFHTIQIDFEQSFVFLQILPRLQRRVSK